MRKLGTKIMTFGLVLALGLTTPVTFPATSTTTVANAATLKLNKTKVSLEVGKAVTLKVTGANKKKVTWSSSKKSVATVNKNGKVTAKAVGKATITAKVSGKKFTCKVTVTKKEVKNKEYSVGNVTFTAPSNITTKITTQEPITMISISMGNNEDEGVTVVNGDYTGMEISYEDWEKSLKSQMEGVKSTEGVTDFKMVEVNAQLGKGYKISYTATDAESKLTMSLVCYEFYTEENYVEISHIITNPDAKLVLTDTFESILKTVALKK
ncbi:Ig-like domain-containing protein [Anaerosporobacter faecicola]|uniref:Ig-like domain-containing protein n=1 Tax=Anaerosporobacter faecicola TaxID=2718714 RepID=UPI001EE5E287|nr:Ig-like domain-containing protein [Anaerosporobacter faecicola]